MDNKETTVRKGSGNVWDAQIKQNAQFYSEIKSLHQFAKENNKSIYFKFNGVGRTMPPNYPFIEEIVAYSIGLKEKIEKEVYMKSFPYQSKEESVKQMEKVLKNADQAFESEETLVKWLGDLAKVLNDNEAVKYDHEALAQKINENQQKYSFNYDFNQKFNLAVGLNKNGMTQKQLLAMYVIGNVYDSFKEGSGIAYKDKIYNIAQKYNALVEEEYFATTEKVLSVKEKTIDTWTVSIQIGAELDDVLKQAIRMATKQNVNVELIFNEVPFKIDEKSNLENLQEYYSEKFQELHAPKEKKVEPQIENKEEVLDKIQEVRKKSKLSTIVDKIKSAF